MNKTLVIIATCVGAAFALRLGTAGEQPRQETHAQPVVRIGTYDNRAVAIAYAGSRFNDVAAKTKELEQAKAAGDNARVQELQAWGQAHQRELHRQGFGRVPVSNLFEPIKDRLPEFARAHNVDAIAFECNYVGPNVEQIDITMELVKLYEPSERTMQWITQAVKAPPVDLDEIDRGHD